MCRLDHPGLGEWTVEATRARLPLVLARVNAALAADAQEQGLNPKIVEVHWNLVAYQEFPPDVRARDYLRSLQVRLTPIARGSCDHRHAETGYRPSRKLQHLIRTRSTCCTAPGCTRPAARCDLDHTLAWDVGGITCECGLAPLCRHHHRCKQANGWSLIQPEPGVLVWCTPHGRTFTTTPSEYPL